MLSKFGDYILSIFRRKEKKDKSKEARILLTEEDFIKLTSGEIVEKEEVKFALQDIGFERMSSIIAGNFYKSRYKS
jgi:uncharacterized protein (DUF1697 family)